MAILRPVLADFYFTHHFPSCIFMEPTLRPHKKILKQLFRASSKAGLLFWSFGYFLHAPPLLFFARDFAIAIFGSCFQAQHRIEIVQQPLHGLT